MKKFDVDQVVNVVVYAGLSRHAFSARIVAINGSDYLIEEPNGARQWVGYIDIADAN